MKWKLALGLALSALFLWLAFRDARLGEVWHALLSANYWLMIPGLVLTLMAFVFRSWRWGYLLATVQRVGFGPLFGSTMVGFMGNNVLPARLGELLRAHSLGRKTGISRSAVLASIVVERIFDIFVMLLLFGTILLLRGLPREIRSWGLILFIGALPVGVALVLYRSHSERILKLLDRVLPLRARPRAREMAVNFREGLGIFGRGRSMMAALLCSILMWFSLAGVVLLCLRALDLQVAVGAAVAVLVIMAIGTMIPSAPGYIGTMQYAGTLALLQFGVDRSRALSFTVLYHASQWIPVTLIGLYFFLHENLSVRIPPLKENPLEGGAQRSMNELEGRLTRDRSGPAAPETKTSGSSKTGAQVPGPLEQGSRPRGSRVPERES